MSVVLQCREAMALLTEGTDGALRGATAATFALHIKTCRPCSRYRKQMERALELLAALPPQPVATSEVDDIVAMLESAMG